MKADRQKSPDERQQRIKGGTSPETRADNNTDSRTRNPTDDGEKMLWGQERSATRRARSCLFSPTFSEVSKSQSCQQQKGCMRERRRERLPATPRSCLDSAAGTWRVMFPTEACLPELPFQHNRKQQ
ncbi:hypothetical protein FQA47_019502 [Oryzias melastigma]|uniref:Uncharacterized protein n=1 Tax=Oryzias melastigma TaxID=30732 RepID=A0A834CBU8_ORYME|nr:hypothetical protein FQA47_019502 [Oryzias melastigma]